MVKASQAVSGEIVLDKLIDTLMRITLEHAGAERGLLILLRGDELQDRSGSHDAPGHIEVTFDETRVSPASSAAIRSPLRDPDAGEPDPG